MNGMIVGMIEIVTIFMGFVSGKVYYYTFQLSTISGHLMLFYCKTDHLRQ